MKNIDADLAGTASPLRTLQLPNAVADFDRSEIRHADGQRAELSVREAELLHFLASHPGRPVSRDEILREVWGLDPRNLITRTIDMHVVHLRNKLQDNSSRPRLLLTVRGEGYMFARLDPTPAPAPTPCAA
jgi:DNA-binding response OmpR family regulator